MRKQTGGKFGPAPGSPLDKVIMFRSSITLANIQEATGQFDEDHVLIRTRHGIVFKAILQVWRTFAMPFSLSVFFLGLGLSDGILLYRMGPWCQCGDCRMEDSLFKAEAEILWKEKRRNLTVLRGYYVHGDVQLLVYDYMPNNSLASLLQEAS
jgi:hypothetical protein